MTPLKPVLRKKLKGLLAKKYKEIKNKQLNKFI